MSTTVLNVPEQGQLERVRSRQWVVNEVKPSKLPLPVMKPSFDGVQSLITLASVEDDGLGEKLQVVWEVESGATVGRRRRSCGVSGGKIRLFVAGIRGESQSGATKRVREIC